MPMKDYNGHEPNTFVAGADLSSQAIYSAMKLHSTENQVVVCAADTDICIGVLLNQPGSGEGAQVQPLIPGDTIPFIANEAISLAAKIGVVSHRATDATLTAGDTLYGVAREAAAAQDDLFGVFITGVALEHD